MTTQTTHRLAFLYITLTIQFILQICASHPLIHRWDVSTNTNKTLLLTLYHKDMFLYEERLQSLWPIETRAGKDEGQALHTHLQQPSTWVRSHQLKPSAQHQQYTTRHQASKRNTLQVHDASRHGSCKGKRRRQTVTQPPTNH